MHITYVPAGHPELWLNFLTLFFSPHTWRAGTTVEGAHGVQALNHGNGGAAAIIGQTFVHILTAVAIALPT